MRYFYNCNDGLNTDKSTAHIEAMSYKKMLKILPSKYPEGTIVNVSYTNKKKKIIVRDVKVGSNDWDICRCTNGAQGFNLGLYFFDTKRNTNGA